MYYGEETICYITANRFDVALLCFPSHGTRQVPCELRIHHFHGTIGSSGLDLWPLKQASNPYSLPPVTRRCFSHHNDTKRSWTRGVPAWPSKMLGPVDGFWIGARRKRPNERKALVQLISRDAMGVLCSRHIKRWKWQIREISSFSPPST